MPRPACHRLAPEAVQPGMIVPRRLVLLCLLAALTLASPGAEPGSPGPARCEVLPLPGHQAAFLVDGVEATRWHFGPEYPRPFFYPFRGPSGAALTRMGHPGASNHDHHRSIWLAHQKVGGVDFWSENTAARVEQTQWLAYQDGDEEAVMAAEAKWRDGEGKTLMEQELVAALRPLEGGESALEIQITLGPPPGAEQVELGQTNFGFLAVRVAKSLSAHFGGGQLTSSEGLEGEEAIFGQPARWMDYSGPVAAGSGPGRVQVIEGITYHDHPDNPRHPARWHVRSDGWMGASFCMEEGHAILAGQPLVLRYLLHAHAGPCDPARAEAMAAGFAARPGFAVRKSGQPHLDREVKRLPAAP